MRCDTMSCHGVKTRIFTRTYFLITFSSWCNDDAMSVRECACIVLSTDELSNRISLHPMWMLGNEKWSAELFVIPFEHRSSIFFYVFRYLRLKQELFLLFFDRSWYRGRQFMFTFFPCLVYKRTECIWTALWDACFCFQQNKKMYNKINKSWII